MHKLIFEGAELTGKSFSIYPVWNALEEKYNSGLGIMDGCIWINADVGVFGSENGWRLVEKYVEMAEIFDSQNIIFEKLHLTNHIYTDYSNQKKYEEITQRLNQAGFKIILTTTKPDPNIFSSRINDRLRSNTAYQRIAKPTQWYIDKQQEYISLLDTSPLPSLTIDNTVIPNDNYQSVLSWLHE